MCAWGWAWPDVPQAPSFSSRLLVGLPQASEDIRVVLGCKEVVGLDSLGIERIGQHGFPCGHWHPSPRRLEAAVLHRPLAGPVDQALEGGLCPGPLSQLPELRVGPALPPLSMGGDVGLGGGVGVGVHSGVMGTGGAWGPRGVLVVLCRGSAWGAGAWAYVNPWVRAHGLRFRVGLGFAVVAVVGHLLDVGRQWGGCRGAGTLLVGPGNALVWSGLVHGPGVRALSGGWTRCVAPRSQRVPP